MKSVSASARAVAPEALPNGPFGSFLEFNLASCRILGETKKAVLDSPAQGQLEVLADGSTLIRRDGVALGASMSNRDVFEQLRNVSDAHVVVVFGLGVAQLPHVIRAVKSVPVVVFEPDPAVLRRVLEHGPLDVGDVPIVSTELDLTRVWRDFSSRPVDVLLIPTPGYCQAYAEELEQLKKWIPELLQRVAISKATYQSRGRFWARDIVQNVELLSSSPHFLSLAGQLSGVPAFIVGAGPSLDGNVEHLREAADKGILFATNSGAVSLARHGIEPQVVVCIESIDASTKLERLPFISRAVRAFSLAAAPACLRTGEGPLLPIHEAVPQFCGPLEELTGCPGLSMSSSVSTIAASLARALGCDPIVLVGQDLAYSNGRTYAAGTGYEDSVARVCDATGMIHLDWVDEAKRMHGQEQGALRTEEPLRRVVAWGGEGFVDSGLGFAGVQAWFETAAALMRSAGEKTRLINATEGGVRIAGFEEQRLVDALKQLPVQRITAADLAASAREAWQGVSPQRIVDWLAQQARGAREVRVLARRVRRWASHAARATRDGSPGSVTRAYERLGHAEIELRAAIPACPFVDAWSYRAVDDAMTRSALAVQRASTDARQAAHEAILSGARVARAVEVSAIELIDALASASAKIERREQPSKAEN